MAHDAPDKQLIRRFQRGDRGAFETFVRRHSDRTRRLACVWLDQPGDADDVCQDVFLRAYTGLGSFRFAAEPATWLFRMTRNVCNEFNRRQRRDRLPLPPDERDFAADGARALRESQTVAAVRQLVASLPERQRDVVLLRVFEELSIRDTARVMRCRPGTVKATLHKAMQNLKARYDEEGGGE